jgi:hypothetical protein
VRPIRRRFGQDPEPEGATVRGPRQAHLDGFDLHANVWVGQTPARGWSACAGTYCVRRSRKSGCASGRRPRDARAEPGVPDGTSELVFEPLEFLEGLAAMTPRPDSNLLICHGVLARALGARSRRHPEDPRAPGDRPLKDEPRPRPARARRRRVLIWSSSARRTPSCLRREASAVLIRPVCVPLDRGGVPA